ncbi:hypothetical protein CIPAW_03G094200 [Carya illinoinensis]|uniref:Lipoprotein n=1 Tax=Carya illinoinensis TaxID=32201 RepID=A0A8T1R1R5_CARIL|nr:hypothetical protein CIPAW_03G094200 [Carya illinoinensis]
MFNQKKLHPFVFVILLSCSRIFSGCKVADKGQRVEKQEKRGESPEEGANGKGFRETKMKLKINAKPNSEGRKTGKERRKYNLNKGSGIYRNEAALSEKLAVGLIGK